MAFSLALARAGDCLCGVNVAWHRDARNRSVSCVDAQRRRDQALEPRRMAPQRRFQPRHALRLVPNRGGQSGVR